MNFFPDPPPLKSSNLCLACKSIFDPTSARDPSSNEVAHHGLEALAIRATRGCHLCLTVYMAIDPDAFKNFREKARSVGFAGVSPIGRDQAKLRFRYLGPLEAGGGRSKAPTRPGTSSGLPVMSAPGSSHGSSDEGSWASGGDDGRLVVELMMVNPRCEFGPLAGNGPRTNTCLNRCGRAWRENTARSSGEHRLARQSESCANVAT